MMHQVRVFLTLGLCLSALALGVSLTESRLYGQGKGQDDAKVILPRGNRDKLEKPTKEQRDAWNALVKGDRAYAGSEKDKEVIDTAAQLFAYRVTWTWYHDEPSKMDQLYKEFDGALTTAQKNRYKVEKFLDAYAKQLMGYLKEVMQNDRAIARVNAARMLARLAAVGVEDVGDVLAETLQDPKQLDAVKLYVLKGFQAYFNQTRGEKFNLRIRNEEREQRCLQALLAFLQRKPSEELLAFLNRKQTDDEPSPEEEAALRPLREQVAAFHYVRREAVKALGETRKPGFMGKDKRLLPETRTALELLKFLRHDGYTPPADLTEQIEAAVAVCQLEAKELTIYQPDYAAAQIGWFLIDFLQRGLDEREKKQEPWRYHARHLSAALDEFKNNSRNTDGSTYVNNFVGRAQPLVDQFERGQTPTPADLRTWLTQNPPKATSLYRGVEDAVVKSPEKE
jgi:hypothetical protein